MLRPARDDELPAIVALANRAFRGRGAVESWNVEDCIAGDRLSEATLRADLAAHPQALLLVRDADGAIDACVWLEPEAGASWHLGLFAVEPALQNGGHGKRLLAMAEAFAAERGARSMAIEVVNARASLIAWYERRGYVRTGATAPWPYGDDRWGVPQRDDLAFVALSKTIGRGGGVPLPARLHQNA